MNIKIFCHSSLFSSWPGYGLISTPENILFDGSLVIYINSTNIPPIMIINMIYSYEHQNILSL